MSTNEQKVDHLTALLESTDTCTSPPDDATSISHTFAVFMGIREYETAVPTPAREFCEGS